MPWPSRSRSSPAASAPGRRPVALEQLRPRSSAELYDAAMTLLFSRPALLVPLGALHVLPVALGFAALAFLPGRVFGLATPEVPAEGGLLGGVSFATAALALFTAAAIGLRPVALAATATAVSELLGGGEPRPWACLEAALRRGRALIAVSAHCLLLDLLTLGLLRIGGRRHVLAPLVMLEAQEPAAARREAARLAAVHTRARIELNSNAVLLLLGVFINLWSGSFLGIEVGRFLFGLDLAVARDFVSPGNPPFALLLVVVSVLLLEPLRAVVKSLHFLDLRLREEGTDLKLRLARLA